MSRPTFKSLHPKTLIAAAALACVVGAGVWLYAAPASPASTSKPVAARQPETGQPTRAAGKKEVLPSIAVTLTRRGFEPAEVMMGKGRFFLTVENRGGRRDITLLIDAEHGGRVREVKQPDDELDWTDELRLTPGRYTLTTAERPDWVCRVTVTAQ